MLNVGESLVRNRTHTHTHNLKTSPTNYLLITKRKIVTLKWKGTGKCYLNKVTKVNITKNEANQPHIALHRMP